MRTRMLLLIVLLALSISLFGCGGGGGGGSSNTGPTANVSGIWSGTWSSSKVVATGAISASITQSTDRFPNTIAGNINLTGSPCFSTDIISGGTVLGNTVSWSSPGIGNFTGTVSGTTITGTYSVTLAGACLGDAGTFSVTKI